jgi:hypothetical protein
MKQFITFGTVLIFIGLGLATTLAIGIPRPQSSPFSSTKGVKIQASGAAMGIGSYINSIGQSSDRESATNSLGELGGQWTRLEIPNNLTDDYSATDDAVLKIRAKNVNILGLFAHKSGLTTTEFESFVNTVVNRYKNDIKAWEIFNEIDNTLSASEYKPFLEKAYNKIRAIQSDGKIIASGLTGRKEAIEYWKAIYDAGGGSYFDALGIHPYRTNAPEVKEFNNGSMIDSINQAVTVINDRGGGKKIWVTEFGWKSGSVGETTQGNYLARGLALAASIAEVEAIIPYRLWDDTDGSFGILKTDYSKKSSFETMKTAISNLQGKAFSERVSATEQKKIDDFDGGVSSWKKDGVGYTLDLSGATGRNGSGMKFAWTFSSGTGYAIAERFVKLEGEPSGLAVWINGNNSTSVWKLRIKDANGETFQFDLGQAPSGWHQLTFDFSKDKAKTSWGGDGIINYPIQFESIVLDNQNGSTSGEATIDDLYALYGDTDLYAMKFGSTLAYWKASGSATAEVCGKSLTFEVYVKYTTVSSCTAPAPEPTPEPSSEPNPTPKPTPSPTINYTKSKTSVDKTEALADGQDTIVARVDLKDKNDKPLQSSKLTVTVTGDHNIVSLPEYKDDHYDVKIQSTGAGDKEVIAKVNTTQVGQAVKIVFKEAPKPAEPEPIKPQKVILPLPVIEASTIQAEPFYQDPQVLGASAIGLGSLIVAGLVVWKYLIPRFRR